MVSLESENPKNEAKPEQKQSKPAEPIPINAPLPILIKKGLIRKVVPGMFVSKDIVASLNSEVIRILRKAEKRATANNRKTIQARDV